MQPMMRDAALVLALVVLFATSVTAHVAIVAGLAVRPPRWRAAAAFALPLLAPIFAFSERMKVRGVIWCVAVVAYGITLALSMK
ncbi:MAG: hypothetical protein HY898_20545 [Deltaproteobacteria bacterium]|nr:hypothetical protein [Deltaproteobacteria bacterium]